MNRTADNTTVRSCGFAFLPLNPAEIFPDLHAVLIARIVVNALTCPIIILLNILVMVAVKTKRQLRTKSNIALACLAMTDLTVGLIQPFRAVSETLLLKGEADISCTLKDLSTAVMGRCVISSISHLLLMSAERYVAIKHVFAYENLVTEVRIMIASGLVWAAAIIVPAENLFPINRQIVSALASSVILFFFLPAMVYFNIAVYKEVRRNEKQIAANQVSLEAKEKFLKNKRAFYTTTIVLLVIFLCYIPVRFCAFILISFNDKIPANVGYVAFYLLGLLPVLNSLFNPLIYAVRTRYLRVAFIQLMSRKTISQAEELERKIFGPRQIGVTANVEQEKNRASREDVEQQGNETLNSGHATTVRTQPSL